jgi:hypothetical protein
MGSSLGIVTEFPLWFALLCLLLGALYAILLYIHSERSELSRWVLWLLSVFRFLTVSILAFLLLAPLIKIERSVIERPVVVVGIDNSASMILAADSQQVKNLMPKILNDISQDLHQYTVRIHTFGSDVSQSKELDYKEERTDISGFLSDISIQYSNRNVGAVLLLTDGIVNYGSDPVYTSMNLPWSIHAIGFGDTTIRKDIGISRVITNRELFLHDQFPMEIQIRADHCLDIPTRLTVKHQDRIVFTKQIVPDNNRFSEKITLMLEATGRGWQRYLISLDPVEGEITTGNNEREIYVEVIEQREHIALVYDAPHPDIAAINQALADIKRYSITACTPEQFLLQPDTFSLVILYQVPSIRGSRISPAVIEKIPSILFVVGTMSDLNGFNLLQTGLSVQSRKHSFVESLPEPRNGFPYFTLQEGTLRAIRQFPPLLSPFGAYQSPPLVEICLSQKINGITTKVPMLGFLQNPNQKLGFLFGENLWRWRLANYLDQNDHKAFDELLQKTVQYLLVRQDRRFFRVVTSPSVMINEPVVFTAELFDQSYEPVLDQDIEIELVDEQGNTYPFTMAHTGTVYTLNAGSFPPGIYRYKAQTNLGQEAFEEQGSFIVAPVHLEEIDLQANHKMLSRLTSAHNGKLVLAEDYETLIETLQEDQTIHAVAYPEKRFTELIALPWILVLILLLISAEWFLRKYNGLL